MTTRKIPLLFLGLLMACGDSAPEYRVWIGGWERKESLATHTTSRTQVTVGEVEYVSCARLVPREGSTCGAYDTHPCALFELHLPEQEQLRRMPVVFSPSGPTHLALIGQSPGVVSAMLHTEVGPYILEIEVTEH